MFKSAKAIIAYVVFAITLIPLPSSATSINFSAIEADMDLIFSQATFGTDPIDIRFNPIQHVAGPTTINSASDLSNLFSLAPDPSPTSNVFFVDAINWCGSPGTNIIGCGLTPGNKLAVDAGFVASSSAALGADLIAHELGHNLGLGHVIDSTNLMNPVLLGGTSLTASQVSTILSSPLVQTDPNTHHLFISLTPLFVPEPGTWALVGLGFALMKTRKSKDSKAHALNA